MLFIRKTESLRAPWNKGRIIGQKPPLKPKHVWAIRTRLQMDEKWRDLAMFNLNGAKPLYPAKLGLQPTSDVNLNCKSFNKSYSCN